MLSSNERMRSIETSVAIESWRFDVPFKIARGSVSEVQLITVRLSDGACSGQGECCPVPHYGESVESVHQVIQQMLAELESGSDWDDLHDRTPPGAARNAVDCAMWDLRAKQAGSTVATLLGAAPLRPVATVMTLGIDTPQAMALNARAPAKSHSVLKIKLGSGGDDMDRVAAIRAAAPGCRMIVDVNEGWTLPVLVENLPRLAALGVEMVEQPLPAGSDHGLAGIEHLVPLGADESCHVTADLDRLVGMYDLVNIKLDKTGGLTEAMRLGEAARARGFATMIGCMVGTSLAMAPGVVVAQHCKYVDLDGPLLMGRDRTPSLRYEGELVHPAAPELWG